MTKSFLLFSALFLAVGFAAEAKTVRYELTATSQKVNLSGKKEVDFAILVNGGIPAPTLEFTEGDDAVIVVKNRLPQEELSVHWHGLLLPNEMDGVPYVTTPPIPAGQEFTFKFPLRQHGTYWYHSHTEVQEQRGVYGAIVIHPKKETLKVDQDLVVVLSDWSDENANQILKNLRKDGEYYTYKKDTLRSYLGAIREGALGTHLNNEWTRMGGMDLSDVGYDAFLMNGKRDSQLAVALPGNRVRLRVINAAASSYFYLSLGQGPMQVIAADGQDVEPILAKDLLIGMAETYDVLFEIPEHKNFELRATAQDGTGFASGWIGTGPKVAAPTRPPPDQYMSMDMDMDMDMDMSHMDHMDHDEMPGMKMDQEVESLTVEDLKSPVNTEIPKQVPVTDVKLVLDGDMERYIWHINGKAMFEDRNIPVKEGQAFRFTFENKSMMHHPMHLHGHFFRVLNKNGAFSPLKHTVDVPPHGTRVIEFYANEPGEWLLHCHNLYHMKSGMARVAKYLSFQPKPEILAIQKYDHHMHDHWYYAGQAQAATNFGQLRLRASQTWNEVDARFEARHDEDWNGEGDLFYRRWQDKYLNWVAGVSAAHHDVRAEIGVHYLLPMLIESQWLIDPHGQMRVDLGKRFQWSKTLFSEVEYIWRQDPELDSEVTTSLMYQNSWAWAAGLTYTGRSFGAGFQYQF
jgi:FtsP/CotA-like multicopper oxidase with cupredoxin domain